MAFRMPLGRLFWKLVLALSMSMLLTMVGGITYLLLNGRSLPPIPHGEPMVGFIPLIPLLSALIAITLIGLVLAWYLSLPLRHLRWALRRVAHGHLDTRVRPLMRGRRDEIADLAHDFDGMAEQLQSAVESQRTLLHDVSHELRSPLTRLQAAIGLIRQDPSLTNSMLERIEAESERLNDLIEELLTLHRLEAGAPASSPERVDLIELLQSIADDAEFEAQASGRTVSIEASGSFVVPVHGELIYRAFENVVRNAVKYSPRGATVEIRAVIEAQGLTVSVADRGPGVPPEMLASIFQPFVRIGNTENLQGTGLGLTIAHRAMVMHGAQVQAEPRQGGGLVIRLRFPICPESRLYPA